MTETVLPRPRDTIGRKDKFQSRRTLMKLFHEIRDFQSHRADMATLLQDPKKFIATFVRGSISKRRLRRS